MNSRLHWAAAGALALAAGVALASDGTLEINQACATSTAGCFPGDIGGGFPVEITQTETSYRLTSSLLVPTANTTAINVIPENANVTIDLGGFTIRGVTTCTGIPISSCSPTGSGVGVLATGDVFLRNGFITQMGSDGVQVGYSSSIENVRILLNGRHGLSGGDAVSALRVFATSNGGDGIKLGIESAVADSLANGNAGAGIRVVSGTVSDSIASRNGEQGAAMTPYVGFHGNQAMQNGAGSFDKGHATGGNVCDDGRCSTKAQRRFYLTPAYFTPPQAPTACAPGFHFGSLWEIHDPSQASYDTTLGFTSPDSGSGPPAAVSGLDGAGWIRQGNDTTPAGGAVSNCKGWSSTLGTDYGGRGYLESLGGNIPADEISPWRVAGRACDTPSRVWCVED
jgi:hypothetical protein